MLRSNALVGTALRTINIEVVDMGAMPPVIVDSPLRLVDLESDRRLGMLLLRLKSNALVGTALIIMSVEDVDTSSRPLVETTLRLVGVGSSDEGIEKLLLVLKSDTLVGTALRTIKVEDVDAEVMLLAVVDSTSRIVDVSDERLARYCSGL